MIEGALHFLCTRLDAHLRRRFGLTSDAARLGPIVDDDGRVAGGGRVVMSLVRIEEEHPRPHHGGRRGGRGDARPPTCLSAYLLVAASGAVDYREGLKALDATVTFFEAHAGFERARYGELPEALDGMVIELISLDFAAMNNLWACLGARYRPSALYRLRSVPVEALAAEAPSVVETVHVDGLA